MTGPFRVYLDCLVAKDIQFQAYTDHRQTRPLDETDFYIGCLAYRSHAMYPRLPKRIIHEFGYMQYAPFAMAHRDVDDMYNDYLNHLVQDEARNIIAPSESSVIDNYFQWYFRV